MAKKELLVSDEHVLTPQQELFVTVYTTRGEYFFNGVHAYAEAYGYDLPLRQDGTVDVNSGDYCTCKVNASRLLREEYMKRAVRNKLLADFNEKVVDARLQEILINGKDTDSLQAIKIFNDIKQRITKKIDVTTQGRPLAGLSDEELKELIEN